MKVVRLPYPNNKTLDENSYFGTLTMRVALSEFIYANDKSGGNGTSGTDVTVSIPSGWYLDSGKGGSGLPSNAAAGLKVTNNSIIPYPKVIARWAWPGYERVTNDFLVEAVAFHRFARNSSPVAAVVFTASDQDGHAVTATSNAMTVSARGGDVNPVLVYAATIPVAGLDQNNVIKVNFRAYPWVGDQASVLDTDPSADGAVQPDENVGPLYELNDKTGAYGTGYALVSPSGSDVNGKVYASQQAAESGSAFATIGKAALAIKAFQNANYQRNSAGGGVILLSEGNYTVSGTTSQNLGTMDTWLTIQPMSTARTAYTDINYATSQSINATKLKVQGLTLNNPTANSTFRGSTATDAIWVHQNQINWPKQAQIYSYKAGYATDNNIASFYTGFVSFGSAKSPFALIRGNMSGPLVAGSLYCELGNQNIVDNYVDGSNKLGQEISDNFIFAFNTDYNIHSAFPSTGIAGHTAIVKGMAFVQNVLESLVTLQPLLQVSSDSSTADANNVILWHNTLAGARSNLGYNEFDANTPARYNWSTKFNIYRQWNTKTDTFGGLPGGPNGARIGNWPVVYNVGSVGDLAQDTHYAPDFNGLYAIYGPWVPNFMSAGYVSDNSYSGNGTAYGNYSLVSTSPAIDLSKSPSPFDRLLPYDILGNPRDSYPDSGAYEYRQP